MGCTRERSVSSPSASVSKRLSAPVIDKCLLPHQRQQTLFAPRLIMPNFYGVTDDCGCSLTNSRLASLSSSILFLCEREPGTG